MAKIYLENNYLLEEDEYLLKIKASGNSTPDTGFLTKLNKDGSIPINFQNWTGDYSQIKLPYKIVKEEYKEGWKIYGTRYGESQNWVIMLHPNGFTVEIHMDNFINMLQNNMCRKGVIRGKFKWSKGKLLSQ